jgi:hypothetical protein
MTDPDYERFARAVIAGGILSDPWCDGAPRFTAEPERLSPELLRDLYRVGEQIAAVYDEVCRIVADDEPLLADFFALTPIQRALWLTSAPLWHGIARADVFLTDDGFAVAELNCDTPTGEAEATELARLVHPHHASLTDPNADLQARFTAMVDAYARSWLQGDAPRSAGIVYPTEFTEDLCVVKLYQRWLAEAGYSVVLGSPYNLGQTADGRATLFDVPVSVSCATTRPTGGPSARARGTTTRSSTRTAARPAAILSRRRRPPAHRVVNPFGAVLPQNKRAMAFMWEHIHRFSPQSQQDHRSPDPVHRRLEALHPEMLLARARLGAQERLRGRGRRGDPRPRRHDEIWAASLAHARRGRWVAQRYFHARLRPGGDVANYGVFVIAGEAAGLYLRTHRGKTDEPRSACRCSPPRQR